ncbi:MAG: UvrD-helicase domain-containing protein [Sedimentisphaerales bacterium]|nr:UvrD-helicase domain-containing protein [Sedimentisphaerales bacterium]
MILDEELLGSLTDAQRRAVTHIDGPMLVIAGPGSGKTRVITHRVAYLIRRGVKPYHILAITFTNKAAQEMRNRLTNLHIPPGATICTFHSLAARLLREFSDKAGVGPDFSIYDDADQKAAMRAVLKSCELDTQSNPPGRMLEKISNFKNNLVTPDNLAGEEPEFITKILAGIYRRYQEYLAENNALDFDDLLMKLAFLLRDDAQLRDRLNNRYQYVLVDEYQDTNHCQYQIARGLALNHSNLFVTGDPDQSIYGWRGADIHNILAFEKDYPETGVVRLEQNFRSTPEVLEAADQVIRVNIKRKVKDLLSTRTSGAPCELLHYSSEYSEADGMVRWIKQLLEAGLNYRDMAVFYRVNSMSRVLEEALRLGHIPYQIVRGLEFYHRREIKDMLAYLRILVNPADQVSLVRIINRPTRGIGTTTLNRLLDHSQNTHVTIWQVLSDLEQVGSLGVSARAKVKKFVDLINKLHTYLEKPVAEIMRKTYELSGLEAIHKAECHEEAQANVKELISGAQRYDQETEHPTLSDHLQQISLISDADAYDMEAGSVSLMTLHAAKGLEFPGVLIVGVEDGLIPHTRSLMERQDVEEERRLLFVGMTRAKDRLALSYAGSRSFQGSTSVQILSQFVRGIPGLDHKRGYYDDLDYDSDGTESMDDDYPDETYDFAVGQLVRHPQLGPGRIMEIIPLRKGPKAIVQFQSGLRRTLALKYANLEPYDPYDY